MKAPNDSNIQFAIATASGRGAVATIIVCGSDSLACVNRLFRPASNRPIAEKHLGSIVYGHWIVEGEQGEDLIVCPKNPEHLEIHCHGGDCATRVITRTLQEAGALHVGQRELAEQLFDSQYLADFQLSLAKAPTKKTAKFLLRQRQAQAVFWNRIESLISQEDTEAIENLTGGCLAWTKFGQRLTTPWTVVLCGEPNVGKSSLINAILGFGRAIVHPVAGTTRDVVHELTAIEGWPVQLFDTAGIRESDDEIEQLGMKQAKRAIGNSDLVVLVFDSSCYSPEELGQQINKCHPDLVVANKADLRSVTGSNIDACVSAKTGSGTEQLIQMIANRLVPELPDLAQPVPVSDFQLELINQVTVLSKENRWQEALSLATVKNKGLAIKKNAKGGDFT